MYCLEVIPALQTVDGISVPQIVNPCLRDTNSGSNLLEIQSDCFSRNIKPLLIRKDESGFSLFNILETLPGCTRLQFFRCLLCFLICQNSYNIGRQLYYSCLAVLERAEGITAVCNRPLL